MEPIRIGLIGAGRMGKNHARVFSNLRHAELVGVHDQNTEAGLALARQSETRFFPDMDDLLDKVDAVSLATPTPTHFDLAIHCLARGLDLFIEKPISATVEEAEKIVAAAAQQARIVQIGHIERFNPTYAELKHVLEDMTVLAIDFRRLSPYTGSNTDVDVVLDLMIHDLDLMLDLVNSPPTEMDAWGITAFSGAIDHAYVTLQAANGPLLSVTASRVTEQKVRHINATAAEAYVDGDLLNKTISVHRSVVGEYRNPRQNGQANGVKYHQESVVERIHVPASEPLLLELQHFVGCVRERRTPAVTAEHGLHALKLAMQIRSEIQDHMRRHRAFVERTQPALTVDFPAPRVNAA